MLRLVTLNHHDDIAASFFGSRRNASQTATVTAWLNDNKVKIEKTRVIHSQNVGKFTTPLPAQPSHNLPLLRVSASSHS